jgi:hypothetical protein
MAFKSPLTRAQYDELKKAERIVLDTLPMIDAAEQCGIECQQYRGMVQSLMEQMSAIQTQFFNPVPK